MDVMVIKTALTTVGPQFLIVKNIVILKIHVTEQKHVENQQILQPMICNVEVQTWGKLFKLAIITLVVPLIAHI